MNKLDLQSGSDSISRTERNRIDLKMVCVCVCLRMEKTSYGTYENWQTLLYECT